MRDQRGTFVSGVSPCQLASAGYRFVLNGIQPVAASDTGTTNNMFGANSTWQMAYLKPGAIRKNEISPFVGAIPYSPTNNSIPSLEPSKRSVTPRLRTPLWNNMRTGK